MDQLGKKINQFDWLITLPVINQSDPVLFDVIMCKEQKSQHMFS